MITLINTTTTTTGKVIIEYEADGTYTKPILKQENYGSSIFDNSTATVHKWVGDKWVTL